MSGRWKEMGRKYWPPRKDQLLILVLLGLLLAVIAIPADGNRKDSKNAAEQEDPQSADLSEKTDTDYETQMEKKLEDLLAQVEGVGQVRVMLTFEGTGEKKVEKDESISTDARQEETVYEEYGSSEKTPYVTSETNPKVEGVLVIAQGGGNSRIKQEILEAAQALFGIDAHKIKIMKMEGTK